MKTTLHRSVPIAFLLLSFLFYCSCKKEFERLMAVRTLSVNKTTYVVSGEVIDVGESNPEYGFCYSTLPYPSLTNSSVKVGKTSSPKTFQATLPGLQTGYTYYVRSYAKGEQGIVYGDELTFTMGSVVEYAYDDGTWEKQWFYDVGLNGHLGNLIPATQSGHIIEIQAYFIEVAGHGSEQLHFDFFDSGKNPIGSTAGFLPPNNGWITFSVNNIAFSGEFYAMVHWNEVPVRTNNLAADTDGPHAYLDLAYFANPPNFSKISSLASGTICNFLIRVKAIVDSENVKTAVDFTGNNQPGLPSNRNIIPVSWPKSEARPNIQNSINK